jgi:hypothetical protein
VGEENRVKTIDSLARAYAEEAPFSNLGLADFLRSLKDMVRFAVQMPERGYVGAVRATLQSLVARGYRVDNLVSFWGDAGRHHGLNVTLTTPTGARMELQFPTELSWAVGKRTHGRYRIVRLSTFDPAERVQAFLEILQINKESGIASRQPRGLHELGEIRHIESTFGRWIRTNPQTWDRYSDSLAADHTSFDEVLARHNLNRDDVFGPGGSDTAHDRPGVRLSGRDGPGGAGPDHEHHRLPGAGGQPAEGGHLERAEDGLDLRTGAGGTVPLRRPLLRPDEGTRSSDGREGCPGPASHDVAERDDPPRDV